jgi:aspartate carbamoyltransferase catalytic subunit
MLGFRHLVSTSQLERGWVESEFFPYCEELRQSNGHGYPGSMQGRAMYCLFYEPSFITRTSFERAMELLGGRAYHTEDASQFFPFGKTKYLDNVMSMLASLHFDLVLLRCSDPGVMEEAQAVDALPVVNGGSVDDHPTQALADLYTLQRELGSIDGAHVAILGRLEQRNVKALLRGLALFRDVKVTLIPFSGPVDQELIAHCESKGTTCVTSTDIESVSEADAIYCNGPSTMSHLQLMKTRDAFNLRIDRQFMSRLKDHCIIMDPMQRSGDFGIEVADRRIAVYRQAENALFSRMALLSRMMPD